MSTTTAERPNRITVAGTPGDPDDRPRAGSNGYYRDPIQGTRHKIMAGDPIPPGAELEDGTTEADTGEGAARIAELESHLENTEAERDKAEARITELEAAEKRAAELEQRLESTTSELEAARASLAERTGESKAGESKAVPGPNENKAQPAPPKRPPAKRAAAEGK